MSNKGTSKIWLSAKILLIVFTVLYLFYNQSFQEYSLLTRPLYFILCILLIVNELLRSKPGVNNKMFNNICIIISTLISGSLLVLVKDLQPGIILYFLFLISDILVRRDKKTANSRVAVLTIHMCVYLLYLIYSTYIQISQQYYSSYQIGNYNIKIFINYIFMAFLYLVFILAFNQIRQKRELESLYFELQEANNKLIENSEKERELAAEKERNRIAQDIHDSLGHSLTALIMYQDYLEKIIDNDTTKSKELVSKCVNLSRQTLTDLRKAVYMLKQDGESFNFVDSVKKIITDIMGIDNIDIIFNYTENVDELPLNIKEALYRTIREALTNCMNNSDATYIDVKLNVENEYITLNIRDNGCGVNKIIKGIGLAGIEERIQKIGGSVEFESGKNSGFEIRVSIPANKVFSLYA